MRSLIRPIILTLLFSTTAILLSACGLLGSGLQYGGNDINQPFRNEAAAYVVCSDTCKAQAQCGNTVSNDQQIQVVLVNPGAPATQRHGAFIQSDQPVTILESRVEPMIVPVSSDRYKMTFYRVRYAPESGQQVEGWAHGMCVANRALN